jgi:hypothetical protein
VKAVQGPVPPGGGGGVLDGGDTGESWPATARAACGPSGLPPLVGVGGWGRVVGCGWWWRWTPCWVLRKQPARWVVFSGLAGLAGKLRRGCPRVGVVAGWVLVVGVGWVAFVENCTVDASIFVVKLLRAYGGCLGTRSR